MVLNQTLYLNKINRPALYYKVTTSLLLNHIIWLSGPYLLGETNDLQKFELGLIYELEDNDCIQADDIYTKQATHKVKCPGSSE